MFDVFCQALKNVVEGPIYSLIGFMALACATGIMPPEMVPPCMFISAIANLIGKGPKVSEKK